MFWYMLEEGDPIWTLMVSYFMKNYKKEMGVYEIKNLIE